jgi:thiaminase/transcriptional activator TenA
MHATKIERSPAMLGARRFVTCYEWRAKDIHWKTSRRKIMSFFERLKTAASTEWRAYTRYVLDAGMRGDLLALKLALAPCVIGYAEIANRLAVRPGAYAATNPYRVWIAEYAGAPYQEVAAKARAQLDRLADRYATTAREAELIAIFKEATRLEADFWEMGWRVK